MRKFKSTGLKACFEKQSMLLYQYIEDDKHPRYINSLGSSLEAMLQSENGKGALTEQFKQNISDTHAKLKK